MLAPGTTLGPYEIVATIGSGGMGSVYRARDSRLGREVAIKVSADRFTDRFEREARAIAALNHPHICTLHDVGPNYLVMELVEGPTLFDRIQQGPVPLDEALRIATEIAAALDAAHSKGVVHRDLKPANIKITPGGAVKVLDFGLAKLADEGLADLNAEHSPTMPAATRAGVILGSAPYMAPEQARGRAVDKRADIWALGVVLYEMLAGHRLFEGETATDTLAAVLRNEPALDKVPEQVRPLLRRCLAKDPRDRLRDIGDLDFLTGSATLPGPARRSWWPWSVAAAALAALALLASVHFRERTPEAATVRFQVPTSVTLAPSGNMGLSPDGRQLAFLGTGADGVVRLWIRAMDSFEIQPLAGLETAANAPPFFWSYDGASIAFDAGGVLKRVSAAGGLAQTVCELPATAIGGSWNRDGDILLGNVVGGILRANERGGGTATPITTLDPARQEDAHLLPTFLSDGRHFVYERVSRRAPDRSGVYVGALDVKAEEQSSRQLLPYGRGLTYVPASAGSVGRLLYVREGTLVAQPFDEKRLELAGDPVPIAQQVGTYLDTAFFAASRNGVLVYRAADPTFPITWYDRRGNTLGHISEPGQYSSLALSPDGSRAVASLTNPRDRANSDLWLFDLASGGSPARFTFSVGLRSDSPIFSPDGTRVLFRKGGAGTLLLAQKRLDSAPDDQDEMPPSRSGLVTATSWSPDGRSVLYSGTDKATGWDISVLQFDGGGQLQHTKVIPFARSRFNEVEGRFSPDGRWVAYVSNESGVNEVYVRAFNSSLAGGSASVGGSVLVSRGGGSAPRWRRDGKELFFVAPDDRMMAVTVDAGSAFRAAAPTPLFQTPPGTIVGDVTADGQRFLMVQSGVAPFTVVLNWLKH